MRRIYLILCIINSVVSTALFAASYTQGQEKVIREKNQRLAGLTSEYRAVHAEEREQNYVIAYFVPYIDAAVRIKELVDEDMKEIEKSLGSLDKIPDTKIMNDIPSERMSNFYIETVAGFNTLELACYSVRSTTAYTLPRLSRLEDIHGKYIKEQQLIDKHMPSVRGVIGNLVEYARTCKNFLIEQSKKCKRKKKQHKRCFLCYRSRAKRKKYPYH